MAADRTSDDAPPLAVDAAGDTTWTNADDDWARLRDERFTRSRFLTWATIGASGTLGLAVAGLGALTFLSPLRRRDVQTERNDLGPVGAFPVADYVKQRLTYQGAPGQQVAPRAAYVRRNAAGFVDPLTRTREQFTVIWDRCAHLGCPVTYEGTEFVCPCHGGVYNIEGQRIAGPPLHSLDRFRYRVESGRLVIFGAYSLYPKQDSHGTTRYVPGQLRTPGEPTSGFEGSWYPLQNGKDR